MTKRVDAIIAFIEALADTCHGSLSAATVLQRIGAAFPDTKGSEIIEAFRRVNDKVERRIARAQGADDVEARLAAWATRVRLPEDAPVYRSLKTAAAAGDAEAAELQLVFERAESGGGAHALL